MRGICSVDLATKLEGLGTVHLYKQGGEWHGKFVPISLFGLSDPVTPGALANAFWQFCLTNNVGALLLDGPQGWKSPGNDLCRACEKQTKAPFRTGQRGFVLPRTARKFAEFSIDLFGSLVKQGAKLFDGTGLPEDEVLSVCETFPTAAWRSIKRKPLASKRHSTPGDIQQRFDDLRQEFGVAIEGQPTHDELQAFVAAMAGIPLIEGRIQDCEVAGTRPTLLDGYICEGFIVSPKAWGNTLMRELRNEIGENARLEYKREINLSDKRLQAEFLRDVLSLANSEGEYPRKPAHLIIGVKEGQLHNTSANPLDGAAIGQIFDQWIAPKLPFTFRKRVIDGKRIDTLLICADPKCLYVVREDFRINDKAELRAGQTWGRRADRKVALKGDEIAARIENLKAWHFEQSSAPLLREIEQLRMTVANSGASVEVRKIIYEAEEHEDLREWTAFVQAVRRLHPFLRDGSTSIARTALDGVRPLLRVRFKMPTEAALAVLGVAEACLPLHNVYAKAPDGIAPEEQGLYLSVANLAWEAAYDAVKYAENLLVAEASCKMICDIGRVGRKNELKQIVEAVDRHFGQLRDMATEFQASQLTDLIEYFWLESQFKKPELPPVLTKVMSMRSEN